MSKTDQDQEYVLGTKQLLSAFFVVVALLGVFFTAGYIIGRNTGPKSGATDASANANPGVEAAQRTASRTADPQREKVTEPSAQPLEPNATGTAQAQVTPALATQSETAATKPAQRLSPGIKPEPKPEMLDAVSSQVTPGHLYLQLMAVKRPVADNMVKLLKGRGYPALLGESSKPELFRVLVGPFTDMAALAKTKSGLKSAGFESVIAK